MQLEWIDLIITVVIGLSALTGLFRGVIKEVIALGVWILAIWTGYTYSSKLTPWLHHYIQDPTICTAVAFIIILLGVLLAGGIVNTVLSFMLKSTGLSGMDKMLGMVFGFARGVFIVSLVLAVIKMTSLPYQQYTQSSKICAQFTPIVKWISGYFPAFIDKVKSTNTLASIIDTVPAEA
jgi:membrane protein required for colicin V production